MIRGGDRWRLCENKRANEMKYVCKGNHNGRTHTHNTNRYIYTKDTLIYDVPLGSFLWVGQDGEIPIYSACVCVCVHWKLIRGGAQTQNTNAHTHTHTHTQATERRGLYHMCSTMLRYTYACMHVCMIVRVRACVCVCVYVCIKTVCAYATCHSSLRTACPSSSSLAFASTVTSFSASPIISFTSLEPAMMGERWPSVACE